MNPVRRRLLISLATAFLASACTSEGREGSDAPTTSAHPSSEIRLIATRWTLVSSTPGAPSEISVSLSGVLRVGGCLASVGKVSPATEGRFSFSPVENDCGPAVNDYFSEVRGLSSEGSTELTIKGENDAELSRYSPSGMD